MKPVHEAAVSLASAPSALPTEVRRGHFGRLHRTLCHVQLMSTQTVTAKRFERSTNGGSEQ